jgi:hypothetical protein
MGLYGKCGKTMALSGNMVPQNLLKNAKLY